MNNNKEHDYWKLKQQKCVSKSKSEKIIRIGINISGWRLLLLDKNARAMQGKAK